MCIVRAFAVVVYACAGCHAGTLSVQALQIGDWTLAQTPAGLTITGAGAGGVTVLPSNAIQLGNFIVANNEPELQVRARLQPGCGR